MARPRRVFVPNLSVHVIQRGHNRSAIFGDDRDREEFLLLLQYAAARHGTAVHGFGLMSNHYHLLVTPRDATSLPLTVGQFAGEYVQQYNRKYARIGTLFSGRYRAVLVKDERQWFDCLRYIERNPVKAQIVETPDQYRWSSYRTHAGLEAIDWLTDHPLYTALGQTPAERQAAYRALFGVD